MEVVFAYGNLKQGANIPALPREGDIVSTIFVEDMERRELLVKSICFYASDKPADTGYMEKPFAILIALEDK